MIGGIHFAPGASINFIFEGYTPQAGDIFHFLDADFFDGFNNLSFRFAGRGAGFDFELSEAGSGNIDFLTLQTPAAVPEPATPLLLAQGLAGIAAWRVRRRPAAHGGVTMQ